MTVIKEDKKYRELKERMRMMNNQKSDIKKSNWIEEGKRIAINKVINRIKIINNSLKP